MKSMFFFFVIVVIFLSTQSCDTTEPPPDIPPGNRNIEWTTDTLKMQQGWLYLARIWGDEPENVWAICYGGSVLNRIWQYDGQKWSTDSIPRDISPSSIYGFGRQNIWMGNENSTIWHYNGSTWNLHTTLSKSGFDKIVFNDIWGEEPQNIYAVGAADQFSGTEYTGIIAHYNGSTWKLLDLASLRVSFIQIRKQVSSGLYFLLGVNFESSGIENKLFVFNGQVLTEILPDYKVDLINEINGEVYFVIGKKIYKYNNNQLAIWKDFSGTNFVGFLWGRNEKDFYCKNYDGVGHYNGTDLQTLFTTDLSINGGCVLENNVFLITEDINNNLEIIIRGKIIK